MAGEGLMLLIGTLRSASFTASSEVTSLPLGMGDGKGDALAPETGTVNSGDEVADADPGAETVVISTEAVDKGSEALVCAEAVEPNAEVVDFGAKTVDPCTGTAGFTTPGPVLFSFFEAH